MALIPRMRHYVTITSDGLYHVQNAILGKLGQHHVHTEADFEKWSEDIDDADIKISEGECDCGLEAGWVREHDGEVWKNE